MLTWLLVLGSGAVALAVRGSFNRMKLDWSQLLTPFGDRARASLAERLAADREVILITYDHAKGLTAARGLGMVLDAGHGLMIQFARERLRLLESMRTYSHQASQIQSLPPLWPLRFHLPLLALQAGFLMLADVFLVGSPERFRLRLYLLRHATRRVLSATRRVARGRAGASTLEAALADWDTIDRETLAAFGAVATAILKPTMPKVRLTHRK